MTLWGLTKGAPLGTIFLATLDWFYLNNRLKSTVANN